MSACRVVLEASTTAVAELQQSMSSRLYRQSDILRTMCFMFVCVCVVIKSDWIGSRCPHHLCELHENEQLT